MLVTDNQFFSLWPGRQGNWLYWMSYTSLESEQDYRLILFLQASTSLVSFLSKWTSPWSWHQVNHQVHTSERSHVKWKPTVPLLHNSSYLLLILGKGHSQLGLPKEIKDSSLDAWFQGEYFVVQFSLKSCFITDFLDSGLFTFRPVSTEDLVRTCPLTCILQLRHLCFYFLETQ